MKAPLTTKQVKQLDEGKRLLTDNLKTAELATGVLLFTDKTMSYTLGCANPVDTMKVLMELRSLADDMEKTIYNSAEANGFSGEDVLKDLAQEVKRSSVSRQVVADETTVIDKNGRNQKL